MLLILLSYVSAVLDRFAYCLHLTVLRFLCVTAFTHEIEDFDEKGI